MVLELDVAAFTGGAGTGEAVAVGGDAGVDEEDEVDDAVLVNLVVRLARGSLILGGGRGEGGGGGEGSGMRWVDFDG